MCILRGFVVLYLCFGSTWVPVVVETDLPWLVYVYGNCGLLPVVWLYLGTCYDQKGSFWVTLHWWGFL